MNTNIRIWHQKSDIPDVILDAANSIKVESIEKLQEEGAVDIHYVNNINFLITDGYCPTHRDWKEFTLMWIARNDTDSWVGSVGIKTEKLQPVGTIILLDIDKRHFLNRKNGLKGKIGIWAAAVIANYSKVPTIKQIDKSINKFIQDYK